MNSITFSKYAIYLLPILLVTGPFLSDLAVSLSAILYLIHSFQKKNKFYKNKFFIIFLSFWIFLCINSVLSESFISIKSSIFYIRFGLFLLLVNYFLDRDLQFAINLKKIILFVFMFLVLDSLYQFIFGNNLIGFPKDGRISSLFGDEKILGSFIVKIIPVYISLYFFGKKNIKLDYHIFFISICSIILILLSGERSALGLFIIYIILLLFTTIQNKKKLITYIIVFFSILFFTIINSSRLQNRFLIELKDQFFYTNEVNEIKKVYMFTQAHHYLYLTAYNMFKAKPITGHGTKTFRENCKKPEYKYLNHPYSCSTHPHNFYIQMAAENGIIGLTFLLFLYILLIKDFLKNFFLKNFKNKLLNLSVSSNLVMLWPLIPHGNFFNNWLSILIYFNLSIYIYIKYKYIPHN